MKLAGKTDVGRVRQENQDDYRAGELPGTVIVLGACVRRYGRCTGRTRGFAKRMQRH